MDIVKFNKIKEFQREYEALFQEKLIVDFESMTNVRPVNQEETLTNKLRELCQSYNICFEDIMDRTLRITKERCIERKVLVEYSKYVFKHNFNLNIASSILKRDRTLIYYYAYKKNKLKREVTA